MVELTDWRGHQNMADLHHLCLLTSTHSNSSWLQDQMSSLSSLWSDPTGLSWVPANVSVSPCFSVSLSYALHGEVRLIKWPSGPIQRDQYFVHIPVGQALALMQPDTPAARSFVWLKDSWGHTPIRVCSGQDAPHRPRRPGCVNG